jgi:hypothetical protein
VDGGSVEADMVVGDSARLGGIGEIPTQALPCGTVAAAEVEMNFELVGGVAPHGVAGGAVGNGAEELDLPR